MTEQEKRAAHAMPKTIRRVEQGVYRSLDGAIEIRETEAGWTATVLEVPEGRSSAKGEVLTEKPAKTRAAVVKLLDEQGLLPAEAPKQPEPAQTRASTVTDQTDASGAGGANGGTDKRRPRKPRTKAAATV